MCPRRGDGTKEKSPIPSHHCSPKKVLSEKKNCVSKKTRGKKREEDSKPSLSSKKGLSEKKIVYFFSETESLG